MKETDNEHKFEPYVMEVLSFIQEITEDDLEPTQAVFVSSLGVYGDLCAIYKSKMRQVINVEVIGKIINYVDLNVPEKKELALWTQGVFI